MTRSCSDPEAPPANCELVPLLKHVIRIADATGAIAYDDLDKAVQLTGGTCANRARTREDVMRAINLELIRLMCRTMRRERYVQDPDAKATLINCIRDTVAML